MSDMAKMMAKARKDYGECIGGEGKEYDDPPRLPTGVYTVDFATGGGLPMARQSIIYGVQSSGKTNLALLALASAQRLYPDKKAVFIDIEGTMSATWAQQLGVDTKKWVFVRPYFAEQAIDICYGALVSEDCSIVVYDSIPAMLQEKHADAEPGKQWVGGVAQIMGQLVSKTTLALKRAESEGRHPVLIFINQIRHKIDAGAHGNPETLPGGFGQLFQTSMQIRLYGKNVKDAAINPNVPVWKEMNGHIKKWKVPIFAELFALRMAMHRMPGFRVGQCDDWNLVKGHAEEYGLLGKTESKSEPWQLMGVGFKTLKAIRETLESEPAGMDKLRGMIMERAQTQKLAPSE